MKSPVIKRSIVIAGHKTSVSLEDAFWKGLKDIAGTRDMTLSELVAAIDDPLTIAFTCSGAICRSITEPVRIAFELSGLLAHFRETPSRADALVLLHADSVPARS